LLYRVHYWQDQPRMKHSKTAVAILAALSMSLAVADDFKTTNGKEYKNATVTRVEPDGIVVKSKSGISKVYFTELSKEVQEKYHYNPEAAQKFAAETNEEIKIAAADYQAKQLRQKAEARLPQISFFAIIEVSEYGNDDTTANIQPCVWDDGGWRNVGDRFRGTIDERMPESYEKGIKTVVTLYRIGHTDDSFRGPLFTMNKESDQFSNRPITKIMPNFCVTGQPPAQVYTARRTD
jgi:hypothetical protein